MPQVIIAQGLYERDLDNTEAVFIALRRIAPGEEKTIRDIQRLIYLLMRHHPGLGTADTRTIIEHQMRNFGGFLPGLELIRDDVTHEITSVCHAG